MTARTWRDRVLSWHWVIPAALVVFPLLRLFPLNGHFYIDWYNHKWLTAYVGEYLRQHGSLPVVVNTNEHAGLPVMIFYGSLFYPLMAVLALLFHPGIVLRIVVLIVTWLQFRLITRALMRLDVSSMLSKGISCLVIWAVYPLTNLYNRSAITEYVATALLTSAVATWFLLLEAKDSLERTRHATGFGLLLTLTAGTHPITALYSLPIILLLLIAAYNEHGRDLMFWRALVRSLALPLILSLLALAPWMYGFGAFHKTLGINTDITGMPWFYHVIDRWSTRFFPVPLDSRTNTTPISQLSTPFLDAQTNVPLLLLMIGWLLIFVLRNRGAWKAGLRSTAIGFSAFAFFTWISLSPSSYDVLPAFARLLQIAYRAITYQNLALTFTAFTFASFLRRRRRREFATTDDRPLVAGLLLGCLVVAGSGVLVKWMHASAIMQRRGTSGLRASNSERQRWVTLPEQYYGTHDYTTPSLYTPLSSTERETLHQAPFSIGTGDEFGVPQPVRVNFPTDSWIATNAQAFPWNCIEIDGAPAPPDQLRIDAVRTVVRVPAGEHTLTLQTIPDAAWLVLRAISFATLALWFGWWCYLSVRARRLRHIAAEPDQGAAGQ